MVNLRPEKEGVVGEMKSDIVAWIKVMLNKLK
jgi:hypothetical protein